jgi:hypothetical protein
MGRGTIYLILSVGMGLGGYLPVIFGANALGIWSFVGAFFGGVAAIYVIYRLNS